MFEVVVMLTAGLHRTPDDDVLCISGLIVARYSVAVSKDNEAENEKTFCTFSCKCSHNHDLTDYKTAAK